VKIAFENCAMGGNWQTGDWNIAHNPDAWELMFNETPDDKLGLEWEPCHQLVYLIDPLPQIRKWADRIFHVHGKDATVRWNVIREHGIFGKHDFVWMRHTGIRRFQLDRHHHRTAARGLRGPHRHRGLARSGLPRRAGNDRADPCAKLPEAMQGR
jgi:sugar phosphate isomerase/epimerase